jgi:NAD(P)-dependent dehydrogenase (short-subunit alcohol dehydrogenase family)
MSGPHAVVTGASRGLGAALADTLRVRGWQVTGTSRQGGGDCLALDVTDPSAFAALARELGSRPLELLVCNAGIYPDKGHSLEDGFPPEMWSETFATNVTGVFQTIRTMLPNLRAAERPRIAVISSQMGSSTRAAGGSYIYRASKAAAVNLGRNLAADLAGQGIAVGVYHPGWVRTGMGGPGATLSPEESAACLADRVEALDITTSGRFETWDGREHPF